MCLFRPDAAGNVRTQIPICRTDFERQRSRIRFLFTTLTFSIQNSKGASKVKRAYIAIVLATSIVQGQTWTELGPSPISGGFNGRVSSIACSSTDGNKIYIGGADGGVWKTTNGGSNWNVLTDYSPTHRSVPSLSTPPTTMSYTLEPARPTMLTTVDTGLES